MMDRAEILRIAEDSYLDVGSARNNEALIRFANAIAAHEREECMNVIAEAREQRRMRGITNGYNAFMEAAEAIRSRGNKQD